MKSALLSITLLAAFIISTGCERKLFDNRKKYTGDWEITVVSEITDFVSQPEPYTYTVTTEYPNARISIDASTKNGITIDFDGNNSWGQVKSVTLDENGRFDECAISGYFTSKKELYLIMDNWGHCNSYSAGGYSSQTVRGRKK